MAQVNRKIEGRDHRSRPARALTNEGRIRTIPHNHIAEIFFSIGKSEVELRHDGRHLKPGLAKRLPGLPRNTCSEGLRGEGQLLTAARENISALIQRTRCPKRKCSDRSRHAFGNTRTRHLLKSKRQIAGGKILPCSRFILHGLKMAPSV